MANLSLQGKEPGWWRLRNATGFLLRRTRLLRPAYYALFVADYLKHYRSNQRFRKDHPEFELPPAALMFETFTTTDHQSYYASGLERAQFLSRIINEFHPAGPVRICEWGCGAGRLIRHLPHLNRSRPFSAFGTDYIERSVRWCQEHISDVTFAVNDVAPPLPVGDNEFDFLYSHSVYTHLSARLQRAWLADNLRVVKPGGHVLLTLHGDSYEGRLTTEEKNQYRDTGLVERSGVKDGSPWFTTYNSPDWVEAELLDGLTVVHRETFQNRADPQQDTWVVASP